MSNNNSGGIGLLGALFIAFLCLKLTEVIDWPWFYVTMPLWGPVAIVLVALSLYIPALLIATILKSIFK